MSSAVLQYASIDEVLGPSDSRFFSAGYKRIEHTVRDLWFGRDLETGGSHEERAAFGAKVDATAALGYPDNWSTKSAKRRLTPHLSTIDALVLAVQLAEASLTVRHHLTPAQRRRLWVSRVSMKAGTTPDEDLQALPVNVRAVRRRPLRVGSAPVATGHDATGHDATGQYVTEFRAEIGAMKVNLDVEHDAPATELRPAFAESLDAVLGPAEQRYYGRRYTDADLVLGDVSFDPSGAALTAQVTVHGATGRATAPHGAGAAHLPGLTVVDALVALPQLAQVLMYGLDDMDRGSSDTLWMRRVTVHAPRPLPMPAGTVTAQAAFTRAGTVPLNGDVWRTAELSGQLHGMTATASLAHRLPSTRWSAQGTDVLDLRAAQHHRPRG